MLKYTLLKVLRITTSLAVAILNIIDAALILLSYYLRLRLYLAIKRRIMVLKLKLYLAIKARNMPANLRKYITESYKVKIGKVRLPGIGEIAKPARKIRGSTSS